MCNTLPVSMIDEPCLAARTRRLNRAISGLYDQCLKELGISIGQLDILVSLLFAEKPIRSIDLASEMLMERSTVSRNLKRLANQGLVELRPGPSQREQLVWVTRKGRNLVFRAEGRWTEAQRATRSLLGKDGIRALELVSQRIGKED